MPVFKVPNRLVLLNMPRHEAGQHPNPVFISERISYAFKKQLILLKSISTSGLHDGKLNSRTLLN